MVLIKRTSWNFVQEGVMGKSMSLRVRRSRYILAVCPWERNLIFLEFVASYVKWR
jgi:hypothetical protein